jgi:hypothetical protein
LVVLPDAGHVAFADQAQALLFLMNSLFPKQTEASMCTPG